ncbi:Na+/H+ antiporter NhaB [Vibrio vulnificus]|uniref:Na+/H+ antiporter NhaB n=1 Tax=Vibrio vulnificus TaxID=672 RepID=A0AAN1PMI2_VIBVL|nr:Na+/H+ antiporter NhaB [Vibrio vulnificus]
MLTSALAPLIRLSYGKMVIMALPYTIVLALVGLFGIVFLLEPMTTWFYDAGWIAHHVGEATHAVSGGH